MHWVHLLRGRPGVRIPFGAPDNNAESLCFQGFSAFLIADKIESRYVHRVSICPALGMDRRGALSGLRVAFTYRSGFSKTDVI